jgi:Tetratricopeptide Repeats-Sensor
VELGDTPERRGLIGGRYKRLWREARKVREASGATTPCLDEMRYLESSIENYCLGMELDYNEYYSFIEPPSTAAGAQRGRRCGARHCDRPFRRRRLRAGARAGRGRGVAAPHAARRVVPRGRCQASRRLGKHIKLEGARRWKLSSTLSDLAESIQQTEDLENRKRLQRVFDDLAPLAASAAGI